MFKSLRYPSGFLFSFTERIFCQVYMFNEISIAMLECIFEYINEKAQTNRENMFNMVWKINIVDKTNIYLLAEIFTVVFNLFH